MVVVVVVEVVVVVVAWVVVVPQVDLSTTPRVAYSSLVPHAWALPFAPPPDHAWLTGGAYLSAHAWPSPPADLIRGYGREARDAADRAERASHAWPG